MSCHESENLNWFVEWENQTWRCCNPSLFVSEYTGILQDEACRLMSDVCTCPAVPSLLPPSGL